MKLYRNENTVALVEQQGNWMTVMSLDSDEEFYTYFEFEFFNPMGELPSEEKFWWIVAKQSTNGWSVSGYMPDIYDDLPTKTEILDQLINA